VGIPASPLKTESAGFEFKPAQARLGSLAGTFRSTEGGRCGSETEQAKPLAVVATRTAPAPTAPAFGQLLQVPAAARAMFPLAPVSSSLPRLMGAHQPVRASRALLGRWLHYHPSSNPRAAELTASSVGRVAAEQGAGACRRATGAGPLQPPVPAAWWEAALLSRPIRRLSSPPLSRQGQNPDGRRQLPPCLSARLMLRLVDCLIYQGSSFRHGLQNSGRLGRQVVFGRPNALFLQ